MYVADDYAFIHRRMMELRQETKLTIGIVLTSVLQIGGMQLEDKDDFMIDFKFDFKESEESNFKESEEEWKPPSYSAKGNLFVNVLTILDDVPTWSNRYEAEVDYDSDTCVYWIGEGIGFDYWLSDHCEFPAPGMYVIEGIVGHYFRGTWGFDDDEEEWEYERIRLATPEEIAAYGDNK